MQGTIAQLAALVVHGNGFLAGAVDDAAPFPPSTMNFCEFVRFVDARRGAAGWEETAFAPDPLAWLHRLRENGTHALRLMHAPTDGTAVDGGKIPDRMLAGFVGGGGLWHLEALGETGADHWQGRWKVGDRNHPDRKVWQVTYGRVARNQPIAGLPPIDLEALKRTLAGSLSATAAFARERKLDGFAGAFENALDRLDSPVPARELFHADLCEAPWLPLPASQLLAAAQPAWVFGGMGSWNDLGFEEGLQATYERLSEALYDGLNRAIVAAANASMPDALPSARRKPARPRRWWRLWG
ncbi:hypothetical protein [Fulvimonas soli]|uniref:Uncharacterized protein n=1 Tax=Fulvimonas soli TaxID=155197 RepID=A0A316IHT2_9GAMM|nr:hypothetical protein [Fulvimonas soli]PWK89804.1 hypothetical protein C7456_104156 [Fulvimonas soli]TNY27556.1 hypothetical protein BV497_02500 [Fulvimonas soli]